ncbi:MAG: T9SS type A sorting domain-containing protein [Schleiferiaceae bacterium]|nr:T9SS type A sorting domain-containing protein [Schleiferiaceae bacterium]
MKQTVLLPAWPLMATLLSYSAMAQTSFWTATETTFRGSRLSDIADTAYLLPWDLEALRMRETHQARQWWTDDEGRSVTAAQELKGDRDPWMGPAPAASAQPGEAPLRAAVPPAGIPLDQPLELGHGWTLTWSASIPQQTYAKGDSSIALTWAAAGNQWSVVAEERSFPRQTLNGLCMHDWSFTERSPLVGYGPKGAESRPTLAVQPNPRGRQELVLELVGHDGIWPSAVRCVDAQGRLTESQPPQGALPLRWNPVGLNSGRYIIQIQIGNQTYSVAFIQN